MANLFNLRTACIATLQAHADMLGVPSTCIESVKWGTMPAKAPFVWVEVRPARPSSLEQPATLTIAAIEVFCGLQTDDYLEVLALAERCLRVVTDSIEYIEFTPPEYDSTYDDYCVASFTYNQFYTLSELLDA